jgi:hypothetical protein
MSSHFRPSDEVPPEGVTPTIRVGSDLPSENEKVDNAFPLLFDLYSPLPDIDGVPDEENPLTVRAIVAGILLGSLVNASNIYLGRLLPLSRTTHCALGLPPSRLQCAS